jgi:transposase
MFTDMEQWSTIRRRVLVDGVSKRQVQRETGLHWKTLKKILGHSVPPGYRQSRPRPRRKIGPYEERIRQILQEDQAVPAKQRHTAQRIFVRLREEEGYTGGYTAVREMVKDISQKNREVFVPLAHVPGEAQVDFGHALVKEEGRLRKVAFFVMVLPYSDAVFLKVYERECTETFWDGHVEAFEFFGGVPRRIVYDNTSVAVSQIIGGGKGRRLTQGFLQLQSHYLFEHKFCRVRRANEKGVVEGMVKFTRSNFLVPVPQVRDLAQLNWQLRRRCEEDRQRRVRGKEGIKGQRLAEDRGAMLPLPASRFEACRKQSTTASSLSLVRFDDNDYSVPVAFAHHTVVVKGSCEEVVLCHLQQEVARHRRIWEREQVSFEPLHYLALLEAKPGALDQARPLQGWNLPDCFATLRRRLEGQHGGGGTREYIQVLRLLEKHPLRALRRAVERALQANATSRDAIAQFLIPCEPWRGTLFNLDGHPHLRGVKVQAPDVRAYESLLMKGGVR